MAVFNMGASPTDDMATDQLLYKFPVEVFQDLIAYWAHTYGAEVQDSNEDGSPKVDDDGQPVMRYRTPKEVMRLGANGLVQGTMNGLASWKKQVRDAEQPAIVVPEPDVELV